MSVSLSLSITSVQFIPDCTSLFQQLIFECRKNHAENSPKSGYERKREKKLRYPIDFKKQFNTKWEQKTDFYPRNIRFAGLVKVDPHPIFEKQKKAH